MSKDIVIFMVHRFCKGDKMSVDDFPLWSLDLDEDEDAEKQGKPSILRTLTPEEREVLKRQVTELEKGLHYVEDLQDADATCEVMVPVLYGFDYECIGVSPDVEYASFTGYEVQELGVEIFQDVIPELVQVADDFYSQLKSRAPHEAPAVLRIPTLWSPWSTHDSYTGEYDAGTDYLGVLDFEKLEKSLVGEE